MFFNMSKLSHFQLESELCDVKVYQDLPLTGELSHVQQHNVNSWTETNKKYFMPQVFLVLITLLNIIQVALSKILIL